MPALRNLVAIILLCGLTGCAELDQQSALSIASAEMRKGRYDRALHWLSEAEHGKTPKAAKAAEFAFLRAQCYERSGRVFEAAAVYSYITQQFPTTLYSAEAQARLTAMKHLPGGEIVACGFYQAEPHAPAEKVADAGTREKESAEQAVFTEQTNRIPARLGVRFGIGYILTGLPEDEDVLIRKMVVHPAMRAPSGQKSSHSVDMMRHSTKEGTVASLASYRFDNGYELVPGDWRIEIWYCGRRLVEKTFTVLAPGKGE